MARLRLGPLRTWTFARIHRPTGTRFEFPVTVDCLFRPEIRWYTYDDSDPPRPRITLAEAAVICARWNRAAPGTWHYRILLGDR